VKGDRARGDRARSEKAKGEINRMTIEQPFLPTESP